jgi:glycosyltransferase involved in cell wall biosynthesis
MYPVYACADAVVLCSAKEPFSRAILEAQAAGVPVVAADSGGTPEIVKDGESGLLFRERTPEAVAAPIVRLLTDTAFASRLAAGGHRVVSSRFTIQQHVEKVMTLYDRILAKWHRLAPSLSNRALPATHNQ